ncbi:uncharacterized protein ACA1_293920 [Acanthamoeba castellanii str. Neff]|uniref:Uncharacterized protein n=1 Tax=Acanthamoeba castellanii (strain ATCC 30010 / Neff) TaxID=1257118 RepID=L8HLX5_ACACF|nr:uncharacterized protein ACA1_293920 [Acanthamoeba castellanii str. Neff]ELR25421.1 hypothetical protein ACA1_293920 [Acanthamoeba castellanii str. Neff]
MTAPPGRPQHPPHQEWSHIHGPLQKGSSRGPGVEGGAEEQAPHLPRWPGVQEQVWMAEEKMQVGDTQA